MILTENGVLKLMQRIKSFIASQLNTKANSVHTHSISEIDDLSNLSMGGVLPIGSYIQFAGSQAPAGFLVCNGGAISRTTYSQLFAVIGTTYGSGDGSTTFNLPNLTDRFLQGSTTSGTVKNAGLPNITGFFNYNCTGTTKDVSYTGAIACSPGQSLTGFASGSNTLYVNNTTISATQSNSIYGSSSTVQPPALTCLICIKY